MKKSKRNQKAIMLLMVMVAMMLTIGLNAQDQKRTGGLFGYDQMSGSYSSEENVHQGLMDRGNLNLSNDGMGNQGFNQEPNAPLGSGVLMLIVAGAGYAVVKSKKNNIHQR